MLPRWYVQQTNPIDSLLTFDYSYQIPINIIKSITMKLEVFYSRALMEGNLVLDRFLFFVSGNSTWTYCIAWVCTLPENRESQKLFYLFRDSLLLKTVIQFRIKNLPKSKNIISHSDCQAKQIKYECFLSRHYTWMCRLSHVDTWRIIDLCPIHEDLGKLLARMDTSNMISRLGLHKLADVA